MLVVKSRRKRQYFTLKQKYTTKVNLNPSDDVVLHTLVDYECDSFVMCLWYYTHAVHCPSTTTGRRWHCQDSITQYADVYTLLYLAYPLSLRVILLELRLSCEKSYNTVWSELYYLGWSEIVMGGFEMSW